MSDYRPPIHQTRVKQKPVALNVVMFLSHIQSVKNLRDRKIINIYDKKNGAILIRNHICLSVIVFLISACEVNNKPTGKPNISQNMQAAEDFIDAFYSFDKGRLESALVAAQGSVPSIGFYQGWAEGGNYKVITRSPCVSKTLKLVSCSITVQDDLMLALGIDFNVTDTFEITFSENTIVSIKTHSNDLEVFWAAQKWVEKNHLELVEEPCLGMWDGGPTPGDCVRAMVKGYALFAESDDFHLR